RVPARAALKRLHLDPTLTYRSSPREWRSVTGGCRRVASVAGPVACPGCVSGTMPCMADGDDRPAFDGQWWEGHYPEAGPADGPPGPLLAEELEDLPAGTALDAGCGTGANATWLAERGWEVTALDISAAAVAHAERRALERSPDMAGRIAWGVADLNAWDAP